MNTPYTFGDAIVPCRIEGESPIEVDVYMSWGLGTQQLRSLNPINPKP